MRLFKRQPFLHRLITLSVVGVLLGQALLFSWPALKQSNILAAAPGSMTFSPFHTGPAKVAGVPFVITITAANSSFDETVALSDSTGTISPTRTSNFVNGVWTGTVTVTHTSNADTITATYDVLNTATSSSFQVIANSNAAQLALVSGNGQTGQVASTLPAALKVRTVDPYGNTLSNVNVAFSLQAYPPGATGSLLTATAATTGGDGIAQSFLKLGTKTGTYAVQASVNNGASAVTFFLNATPAALQSLSVVPSAAVVVQSSLQQFSLMASDSYGNAINLTSVGWKVNNGGGTIDSNGLFTSANALGTFTNTIVASVGSVNASATVTIMANNGNPNSSSSNPTDQRNIGLLDHVVITPSPINVPAGSQQLISAQGYDVFNNALATISYGWNSQGDIGSLSSGYGPTSLLKAAALAGSGKLTVKATQGEKVVESEVTVNIIASLGGKIVFTKIDDQKAGTPFTITLTVKDAADNIISSTPTPIILSDSTGTISPRVVSKLSAGVWTGEVTIAAGEEEVVILAQSMGFSGSSNSFKVEGDAIGGFGTGQGGAGGGSIAKTLSYVDNNKLAFALIAGLGLLGSTMALGLLGSRGLIAISRNPLAKKQIYLNLYLSAGIAIIAAFISIALALLLTKL